MRFFILVNRRRGSLSNFRLVTLRPRQDRQSAATKRVRSKLPKFANKKTVSSTSSRARSCSNAVERYGDSDGEGDGVGDGEAADSSPEDFVSKITLPSEISKVLRLASVI